MAITDKKLHDWAKKYDLKRLHKALEEHNYKTRLKAIEYLAQLKNRESLPHLERLIDDAFVSVVKEAAKAIRDITPNHAALRRFEEKVQEKESLEAKLKQRTESSFEPLTEEEEREKLERMAQDYDIMKIYQTGLREERKRMPGKWLAILIAATGTSIISLLYYLFSAS